MERTDAWFVIIPAAPQVQIEAPYSDLFVPQKLAFEMADRLQVHLIDPLPYFREHKDRDLLFYDQCHFITLGNKVMSEFLTLRFTEWAKSKAKVHN